MWQCEQRSPSLHPFCFSTSVPEFWLWKRFHDLRWVFIEEILGNAYLILSLWILSSRCVPRFAEKKYFIQNPRCFKQCWFTIFTFYHIFSSCLVAGTPTDSIRIFRARGRIYMQGRSLNGSSEWYPMFNNPQVGVCGFTMVCYGLLMCFVGWGSPNPGKTIENGFSWIKYDQRRSNPSSKRVNEAALQSNSSYLWVHLWMGHGFHGFHSYVSLPEAIQMLLGIRTGESAAFPADNFR